MRKACVALVIVAASATGGQWEKEMLARIGAIRARYGSGREPALGRRLLAMERKDQDARKWITTRRKDGAAEKKMSRIDQRLTAELKEIVAKHGWPSYDLVGYDASEAAGLILVHSPDREFQRKMLPELAKLAEQGRAGGSKVALVTDKLLRAEGKPQRFGTQFRAEGGELVMDPVEDPEHLDERRARYSLMPMKDYREGLERIYGRKVR